MSPRVVALLVASAACSDPVPLDLDARPDAIVVPSALPARLSETGLYADLATKTIASDNVPFTPAHVLWSDAATKLRWIALPAGAQIDATDMDHWTFPVGTRWFKEFARDGKRLETRLIWRVADTGDREADTLFGSYVWDDTESEAYFTPAGALDVRGTQHDVPSADACWKCHIGEVGRSLGFTAIQLGDVSSLPLSQPAATTFTAPNAALGYLHANCGHCHNPAGGAWASSSMVLRLAAANEEAAATSLVQTTVGVPLQQWLGHGYTDRIVAGDPDASAIVHRMAERTPTVQMPPLATELSDADGIAVVRQWIESL